ncbi:recombinase family protein [Bengtsoniella intestinalis]|uniref:recombinase family protein n=1 Tax=Bengtsoniella intestinalis TaxID=3073143 RepID=UPI00391F86BA
MKNASEKYTILYARLSQDDGSQGDSNSIQNQRLMLEKYAKDNGFENLKFLSDDGYSGTNFNRPAFQELLGLVEDGQVATIIVKDMSRFGREYLQVGHYTEILFPSQGVRFIAMNDGVDSLYGDNEFTPFKNIINEWYAKDCSKKGRAAVRAKAETGARMGGKPPYGYQKDPADPKRKIVPDPESSLVVQKIFTLCMSGKGPNQIANALDAEGIPIPSAHYYQKHKDILVSQTSYSHSKWKCTHIARILEDEVYLGHTISLKHTSVSYKNKKQILRPESEQMRTENTHEPLVDLETWNIVQEIRKRKRRRNNMQEQNIYSGLIVCKDCGKPLVLHRAHTMKASQNNFMCGTYKRQGKDCCTAHYIREHQLAAILLDDLQRVTYYARTQEGQFTQAVSQKNNQQVRKEIATTERSLAKMEKRNEELTTLFKRLYEDNVLGRIPSEVFRKLSDDYLTEQKNLQSAIPEQERKLEELQNSILNVSQFIDKAKRFTELDTLTAEILRLFIAKVEVGERTQKHSHTAPQEIIIHYRDVGLLDRVSEPASNKTEIPA